MWQQSDRSADLNFSRYHHQILDNQALPLGPAYAYPALLDSTLKIRVHNQGQVGATTQRAMDIVADSVFSRNPALVLLEFGANDFLQHVRDSLVEQRLGRLIDTLQWFGSKVIFISFLNPEMIASLPSDHFLASRKQEASVFLEMLRRVATNHAILFVEYAMRGIYWNTNMMSDELHPNQAGYRRMQENISRALVNTFQQNGMLK
jgi:lysophospholipase L1-like esterase